MGLGWGKLYVMIVRSLCFFRRKNNQSAIFTARHKNSHCVNTGLRQGHAKKRQQHSQTPAMFSSLKIILKTDRNPNLYTLTYYCQSFRNWT